MNVIIHPFYDDADMEMILYLGEWRLFQNIFYLLQLEELRVTFPYNCVDNNSLENFLITLAERLPQLRVIDIRKYVIFL